MSKASSTVDDGDPITPNRSVPSTRPSKSCGMSAPSPRLASIAMHGKKDFAYLALIPLADALCRNLTKRRHGARQGLDHAVGQINWIWFQHRGSRTLLL